MPSLPKATAPYKVEVRHRLQPELVGTYHIRKYLTNLVLLYCFTQNLHIRRASANRQKDAA